MSIITLVDQPDLVPTASFPYAKFPYTNFNPVQSRVVDVYNQDCNLVVCANTASGKAQPDDALVLTPHGYCKLGDVEVGDEIIGGNGKITKVIGVYPQGYKEVYKVHFSDGTSTECCEDHLWAIRSRCQREHGLPWRVLPLKEIMTRKKCFYHIPTINVIEFPHRNLSIHPYLLGMLIGDGCIGDGCSRVSNSENEILKRISELLPVECSLKQDGKRYDYRIKGDGIANPINYNLSKMGLLGLRSYEKFIPYIYLFSSIEQRIDLLRGLMDADGIKATHGSPSYSTSSPELAENIAFLIRTLGGRTQVRKKVKNTYRYHGEIKYGRPAYIMTVNLPFNPFGVSSKKNCHANKRKNLLKVMVDFSKAGIKSCRCIKVENEDGLYVTNDLIVTHNTTIAEMVIAYEVRERKNKAVYLAPLKALAQEKIDDWQNESHHFQDLNLSICTGDYRFFKERKKELDKADIVVMTAEMFNSCVRNYKSERNEFLHEVGCLIVDEAHAIDEENRGDHLESALMKFSDFNKKTRFVLLSATMPNETEIGSWIASLTNKTTYILQSDYRPCKLNIHYIRYTDRYSYDENELAKIEQALNLVKKHAQDKFICFVHTKKTGALLVNHLKLIGIESFFHNADLDKEHRIKIERQFREDPKLRVIVATNTISAGLNFPARRICVLGLHRGLQLVKTRAINQAAGRAGRPQYDPCGDAYILVPNTKATEEIKRLKINEPVQSQFCQEKTLAFHLVSEIHHRTVTNKQEILDWYQRSLAYFQNQQIDDIIGKVIKELKKSNIIKEIEGKFEVTSLGILSSMFYFSPFDIADFSRNFKNLFGNNEENNDYCLALALANIKTQQAGICSNAEKDSIKDFRNKLEKCLPKDFKLNDAIVKVANCYFNLVKGLSIPILASVTRNLAVDFNRVVEVLKAMDSISKWNRQDYFIDLQIRATYGVENYLVDLCKIAGIGKVKATKLYNAGLQNRQAVIASPEKIIAALGCSIKVAQEILQEAHI